MDSGLRGEGDTLWRVARIARGRARDFPGKISFRQRLLLPFTERSIDGISKTQILFTSLITLQFIVVAAHDLVDLPGWTHGPQVEALLGRRKVWLVTLVNSVFPGLAVVFAFYFWNRPKPGYVADYWLIYCAITLGSAIAMWYVPYFLGTTEAKKREFSQMYAGTRHVLPPRGDNPRPNLLHVCFHVLFVVTFLLAILLRFPSA